MSNTSINLGCVENIKIKDTSDMNTINFNNTTNVNFIKTFYIATTFGANRYKLTIINIKCVNNQIFVYEIVNNKKNLLNVFNANNNNDNYENLCNDIKLDTTWRKISIPEGKNIYIYDVENMLKGKLLRNTIRLYVDNNSNQLSMDRTTDIESVKIETLNTDNTYTTYIYEDRVIRIFKNYEGMIIKIESLNTKEDTNKMITFIKNPLKYVVLSNNGNYVMAIDKKNTHISIFDLESTSKTNRFVLKYDVSTGNNWLISDDGNVLVNKNQNKILVLMLDKITMSVYTNEIETDDDEYSLMLESVILSNDIKSNTLVMWDNANKVFNLWGILRNKNQEYTISNKMTINYNIPKGFNKISTNGQLFVYKYDKYAIINDISNILILPVIIGYCDELYKILKNVFDNNISTEIIIGNMTTRKKSVLNYKLQYILNPVVKDNKIIMDSYETLDIPIIENTDEEHAMGGMELDSLDLFFSVLNDVSKISNVFNKIKNDSLYGVKSELLLNMFLNLFLVMFDIKFTRRDNMNNLYVSKKYCELCMLYLVVVYKNTKVNCDKDLVNKILNSLQYFTLNS